MLWKCNSGQNVGYTCVPHELPEISCLIDHRCVSALSVSPNYHNYLMRKADFFTDYKMGKSSTSTVQKFVCFCKSLTLTSMHLFQRLLIDMIRDSKNSNIVQY